MAIGSTPKREATRYAELRVLLCVGKIRDLDVHPAIRFMSLRSIATARRGCFETIGTYTADFRYVDVETGEVVVEDVKSPPTRTTAYRLRKRMVEARPRDPPCGRST